MPSILAGTFGSILGLGSIVVAVAVPASLTTRENNSETKEMRFQAPKKEDRKEPKDFENGCFGGFLSKEGEGELIFCEDQGEGKSQLNFYLHWTKAGSNQFTLVKNMNVMFSGADDFEVWFTLDGETTSTRKIIIKREGQNNLNWLGSQSLKDICTKTQDDLNTFLTCDYQVPHDYTYNSHYTYKHTITEFKISN